MYPVEDPERPRPARGLADMLGSREETVETAQVLLVESNELPEGKGLYVRREDVDISSAPRDEEFVRLVCPHLF